MCDVSGSMLTTSDKTGVTIMDVSVSLSLLIAELAEPPFKNLVCTFSSTPSFRMHSLSLLYVILLLSLIDLFAFILFILFLSDEVRGETLVHKYRNLLKADWDMSTNYQAIFDLILSQAKAHKLTNDQMIKRYGGCF